MFYRRVFYLLSRMLRKVDIPQVSIFVNTVTFGIKTDHDKRDKKYLLDRFDFLNQKISSVYIFSRGRMDMLLVSLISMHSTWFRLQLRHHVTKSALTKFHCGKIFFHFICTPADLLNIYL